MSSIELNRARHNRARQKGSHVILKKQTKSGNIVTVVPLHKEIAAPRRYVQ